MALVKPRPVPYSLSPKYPTKLEVEADPELLKKHLPLAWLGRPEMVCIAGALVAGSFSCAPNEGYTQGGAAKKTSIAKHAIVAPLFNHGEGRGSVGCVAVAPPVFLSEEEALQIITEELAKYGVTLTRKNVKWSKVDIPQRQGKSFGHCTLTGTSKSLVVDRIDSKHHIAIEFVGNEDYMDNGGPAPYGTAQTMDFKETAKWVDTQVQQKGPRGTYFAAFYDPAVRMKFTSRKDREQNKGKAIVESKNDLRLQVQDFVNWLKSQGVI